MWEIIESIWSSLAIFLYSLFLHGIILRFLRKKKPNWFINARKHLTLRYFIGTYYGVLGLYFIVRSQRGEDHGVYTDMILDILLILALFGGKSPTLIATLILIAGKLFLTHNYANELIYTFFLMGYFLSSQN